MRPRPQWRRRRSCSSPTSRPPSTSPTSGSWSTRSGTSSASSARRSGCMSGAAGAKLPRGADILASVVTPKLYKAAEVCETAGLQPYVLRSWEKEFPGIGVQKSPEVPRLYRQSDVEQVLKIKQLVFGEGLTLAGARRRLEESSPPSVTVARREAEIAEVLDTLGADARKRIANVRSGLQSILEVLSKDPGAAEFAPMRRSRPAGPPPRAAAAKRRAVAAKASKTTTRRRAGA